MRRFLVTLVVFATVSWPLTAQDRPAPRKDAWIAHITDPHLFVDVTDGKPDDDKKAKILAQRPLNKAALIDALTFASAVLGREGEPRFVILTGDLDADPCWPLDKPTLAGCLAAPVDDARAKLFAEALATSPIEDIYVVPGNNDIATESAMPGALSYFAKVLDAVVAHLNTLKSRVRLHPLFGCYSGGANDSCVVDVANTDYRVIHFPSYPFKNGTKADETANATPQSELFDTFDRVLADAAALHKRVILVAHEPDLDDPYAVAQSRFAGVKRVRPAVGDRTSASGVWNLPVDLMNRWRDALASDAVVAVLAGHLHDSHKEIYRQPYAWSSGDSFRRDIGKLFVTPPLAVKNQDTSPIQARGFSLLHLSDSGVQRRLYWYDDVTHVFAADDPTGPTSPTPRGFFARQERKFKAGVLWLWKLEGASSLERFTIIAIALIAAFLTVVQIWQIPFPDNLVVRKPKASGDASTPKDQRTASNTSTFDPSPYASNFGKAVMYGLGGLGVETVVKSFGGANSSAADKQYYIVWFAVSFFTLLVSGALLRSVTEALRSRFAMTYFIPLPQALVPRTTDEWSLKWNLRRLWHWILYWSVRIRRFVFSLKVQVLTGLDTFINLIQGKNQTVTRVFTVTIIEQQRNIVRVAELVRRELNDVIERKLIRDFPDDVPVVRVNVSVMSEDWSNVFYVAYAPGSAAREFGKRSVAWICAYTGVIRWYVTSFKSSGAFDKLVLFDNARGTVAGDEKEISMKSHYEDRNDDYEAFVVFPLPWPQRAADSPYVRAAVHVSFGKESHFRHIWPAAKIDESRGAYLKEDLEAWCRDTKGHDTEVGTVLRHAVSVLGELLRGFNEDIFRNSTP